MNTSKNISLIDQDFKDITAITPSKRNTSSEGGMLKTGEVLGKARLAVPVLQVAADLSPSTCPH